MCFGSDLVLVCVAMSEEILPISNTSITQTPSRFKALPYILWDIKKM